MNTPFTQLTKYIAILTLCVSSTQALAESRPETSKGSLHPDMRLAPCPKSPNCVNSTHFQDKKHYVKPLILPMSSEQNHRGLILEVLNSFERVKVVRIDDHYIRAEFKSRIFGFVDDVEFLIKESHTDVRSASRVGYSDLGANRKRVEKIRKAIKNL